MTLRRRWDHQLIGLEIAWTLSLRACESMEDFTPRAWEIEGNRASILELEHPNLHQAWSPSLPCLDSSKILELQAWLSSHGEILREREGEEEEWKKKRMRGVKITWVGDLGPLWPATYREERENVLFLWSKMIVVKMWVPKYGPIAQCFKHNGTFILMYIIMHHHFHKLEKIIYQN